MTKTLKQGNCFHPQCNFLQQVRRFVKKQNSLRLLEHDRTTGKITILTLTHGLIAASPSLDHIKLQW